MTNTMTQAEWTIDLLIGGEWVPTPRYVVASCQWEAEDLACDLFPDRTLRVRRTA